MNTKILTLTERGFWIAFTRIPGIGPSRFRRLYELFHGDMEQAWTADRTSLQKCGLDHATIESFLQHRPLISPIQEVEKVAQRDIQVLTWEDDSYPALLRSIDTAPPVLYVEGTLTPEDSVALAIVGTRHPSAYGRQVTSQMSNTLAGNKTTIVSGLALGVDAIAHTSALDAGGRTIAVLASGLDFLYPESNVALAKRIVQSGQGALLTEFPLGTKLDSRNFPSRNRIISGISLGVLVTEAPARSGALITANFAMTQGREVFAVPNTIYASTSEGTNALIRDGAHLVTNIQDILESLNLFLFPQEVRIPVPSLVREDVCKTDDERAVLSVVGHDPLHIDTITQTSGLLASTVSSSLLLLELSGAIRQPVPMHFVLA